MTCDFCGHDVPARVLVCPCGRFTYGKRIADLARRADEIETRDPAAARALWAEALDKLPRDTSQAREVQARVDKLDQTLASERAPEPGAAAKKSVGILAGLGLLATKAKTFLFFLMKAGKLAPMAISMAISVGVYAMAEPLPFALGIVLLIWVHEMGHVIANRFYGMPITAPLFIPGLGAFIRLKAPYRNVVEEAWCGLAGPLLGAIGAWAVFVFGERTGNDICIGLGHIALMINLFNLIPIHPLDGGRASMVLDVKLWVFATAALLGAGLALGEPYVVFLAAFPLPNAMRATRVLAAGGPGADYFRVGFFQRLAPLVAYLGLAALLMASAVHVAPHTERALAKIGKGDDVARITSSLSAEDEEPKPR